MPKILDRLVNQLRDKGMDKDRAFATATSQLQKNGILKKGSQELTDKGKKRNDMTAGERAKDRAAKRSGRKPSEYKYNPKTNIATLKDFIEVNDGLQLDEAFISPNNGAKYGQVIFLVGGAASGKSTAIRNFIDAGSYKVLNPDDTKKLIVRAAQKGSPAFADLKDVDPNTPEGSAELHNYIWKTKISSKRSKLVTTDQNRSELPNLLFDRTFAFAGEFQKISQSLVRAGYQPKNIHVVYVFTDIDVALDRNRNRQRTLPDDVIIKSARGSKQNFLDLFFARAKGAVANGDYFLIFKGGKDYIKVKSSGKRIDRAGDIAKKVIKILTR